MNQLLKLIIGYILLQFSAMAQFPPPAGQEGSTAMYRDSSAFVGWAVDCFVERGFRDVSQPDSGYVNAGEPAMALGTPDNQIVSLGDGGRAVLTFENPIANGPGFDFAVFENSFLDNFLELAFVEASSDGLNYFRFPSVSLTQTDQQVSTFGYIEATQIHNLAGKYRVNYGTPFNLDDLANIPGLNTDSIVKVRIVDVVGNIDTAYSTFDSQGHAVNDPWPTPFASGGFDLDAVGVIHVYWQEVKLNQGRNGIAVYPNPCGDKLFVKASADKDITEIELISLQGQLHYKMNEPNQEFGLDLSGWPSGIYLLRIRAHRHVLTRKIIKQ